MINFKKNKKKKIVNLELYEVLSNLYADSVAASIDLGVSERQVDRWCYEGIIPKKNTMIKVQNKIPDLRISVFYSTEINKGSLKY